MSKLDLGGPIGVMLHNGNGSWEAQLSRAPELEAMGYATIWLAGGQLKQLSQVDDILRATREVPVGTAIIPADRFPAPDVAKTYAQAEAAHPGRFVVGLGGAHGPRPLATLGAYLDHLDDVPPTVPAPTRMLSALGPRMLELARDRTAGSLPLLMTPEHTATTRKLLGEDATLAVMHYVVLETDPARARAAVRDQIGFLTSATGYAANLRRMGFTEDDITHVSDRMVDALVAWGDVDAVAARLREHLDAGADQVALVPETPDEPAPMATERALAAALAPERRGPLADRSTQAVDA